VIIVKLHLTENACPWRIRKSSPGVYNIVDDDPLPIARWLPAFARWVGALEPRRISVEDG